jgi:hypothetical protein
MGKCEQEELKERERRGTMRELKDRKKSEN